MSKLINLIHPYEVENIKTINDFFIVLKNILRLSSKKILEKKDGILIPIRWSNKKNTWVVDRGTDLYRDIEGVEKNNIDKYFLKTEVIYEAILFTLKAINNKKLNSILEKFNLKKNENKFFAFEYCNKKTNIILNSEAKIYPLGLFQRCQTKKRSGIFSKDKKSILIDNSEIVLNSISNCSDIISKPLFFKIKNYHNVFNDFFNKIKKEKYKFILKDTTVEFNISDFLEFNICKETKQKEVLNFINSSFKFDEFTFNKIKYNVIIYLVYFEFFNFIKKKLNIEEKDIEGFVVPDIQNNIYYKVTGDFVLKVFKKNNCMTKKELFPPLLPGVF